MPWAVLASASSRTSPTGRLSVPRSIIAEILSSLSRVTSTMNAFRPEISRVRAAHDGADDPVRAQRLAGAFECVAADRVDDSIERPGGCKLLVLWTERSSKEAADLTDFTVATKKAA